MLKIKKLLFSLLFVGANFFVVNAQTEGSVFNPYSQYGLGELATIGTVESKGMGGATIASRERYTMNLSNPASYTSTMRQNVLFSVSGEGINNYLTDGDISNSRNYFNLSHLALQLRLSDKFGFGLTLANFSNMGYELTDTELNEDIVTNIGRISYDYVGSGGVSQFKTGIGYNPFKNFNIGINYVYYVGTLSEYMSATTYSYVDLSNFKTLTVAKTRNFNHSTFELGAQYTIDLPELTYLTFGAVYQPKMKSEMDYLYYAYTSYSGSLVGDEDILIYDDEDEDIYFPTMLSLGVNYRTSKLVLALDYIYQGWSKSFPNNTEEGYTYRDANKINAGVQYTPNRFDIRNNFKRWSYRAGFSYSSSYIVKDGVNTDEFALSFGCGIPLERNWFSQFSLAATVGQNGAIGDGQLRNNFVKLNLGVTFAANNWFIKFKYD